MGHKDDFIVKMTPAAANVRELFQIHPRCLIAQAAHESRWGLSKLTEYANNLFGMTGVSWKKEGKPVFEIPTWENSALPPDKIRYWDRPGDIVENRQLIDLKTGDTLGWRYKVIRPFRKYGSWEDSCMDWAKMIAQADRYKKSYAAAKTGNLDKFDDALKADKYATDPKYDQVLTVLAKDQLIKAIV